MDRAERCHTNPQGDWRGTCVRSRCSSCSCSGRRASQGASEGPKDLPAAGAKASTPPRTEAGARLPVRRDRERCPAKPPGLLVTLSLAAHGWIANGPACPRGWSPPERRATRGARPCARGLRHEDRGADHDTRPAGRVVEPQVTAIGSTPCTATAPRHAAQADGHRTVRGSSQGDRQDRGWEFARRSTLQPKDIGVGVGREVVYDDVGELPHTAPQTGQEPGLNIVGATAQHLMAASQPEPGAWGLTPSFWDTSHTPGMLGSLWFA